MSEACSSPAPLSAADQALHEMFAETAILLTHKDPERSARAKARVYELLFDTRSPDLSALQAERDRLREALEKIERLGDDGEHSGDRHARCRDIARSALNPHEGEKG